MGLMSLTFGSVNSADYGVYISGHGTFNAPIRRGESVSVPGRNGSYYIDYGSFENIEVTYPAFIGKTSQRDFSEAMSDFRNALAAQKGYQRLMDTYHPDEYRMAVFRGGLEVNTVSSNVAGDFSIIFDCKPQRFLTEGEQRRNVASGSSITNPTLFDVSPTLYVQGYGDIDLDGGQIKVDYIPLGDIVLNESETFGKTFGIDDRIGITKTITFDESLVNAGDSIYLGTTIISYDLEASKRYNPNLTSIRVTSQTGSGATTTASTRGPKTGSFVTTVSPATLRKGTARTITHSFGYRFAYTDIGVIETSGTVAVSVAYDGDHTITVSAGPIGSAASYTVTASGSLGQTDATSTVLASGTITIDLDAGEATFETNGNIINANYAVTLDAELPTLRPGANTVTYSDTFTEFQIKPNWWKV